MLKKLVHITFVFLLANIMLAEVCTLYSWLNNTTQQILVEEEHDHKDHGNDLTKKLKKKSLEEYFNRNAVVMQSIDAFLRKRFHDLELIKHKEPLREILCPPPNFC